MRFLGMVVVLFSVMVTEVVADQNQQFVVHFATGPNWVSDKPFNEQDSAAGHSANLQKLRQAGVIQMGARYGDLGMIIIQQPDIDTARELIATDPGVEAGIFTFTIEPIYVFYPWKEKSNDVGDG